MCGPETTNRPRGGALVALNPPRPRSSTPSSPSSPTTPSAVMTGDLTFHTPGHPDSAEATHARLAFDQPRCPTVTLPSDLHVVIHAGGDMTKDASDCGLFRQIRLAATSPVTEAAAGAVWEWPLPQALSLQVGSDGIIGRRVSVYAGDQDGRTDRAVLAEGIVGFNSWTTERAAL